MPERVAESDNIGEHGQTEYDENAPTNPSDEVRRVWISKFRFERTVFSSR